MAESYYVYTHTRISDSIVFYIGQGSGERAWAKGDRNPHWHRTVKKHGYSVYLAHENLTKAEAANKEIELIAYYRKVSGSKLTNITAGGDGGMLGYNHKPESKEKIVASLIGNKRAIGNTNRKGAVLSEETKQKIREKRALQKPRVGYLTSEETREKLRLAQSGKKQSADTIEKKRIAALGRVMSPEDIEKSASKRRGKTRTPEQVERMSIAQSKVNRKILKTPEEIEAYKDLRNARKRDRRALAK